LSECKGKLGSPLELKSNLKPRQMMINPSSHKASKGKQNPAYSHV